MKLTLYHVHFRVRLQTTLWHHLVSIGIVILLAAVLSVLILHFVNPRNTFNIQSISGKEILIATTNTFSRMFMAYLFSLIIAIPVALLIASTRRLQQMLLPIADILQSVPVLAFFPVIVVFFTLYHAFELAAIFVIFMSMLWNIVFPVIGGLQTIPDDINSAAVVFNVQGYKKLWYIKLPAVFPFIVTGSLLAWAQGWTIVIVAEVLHTYIPHGTMGQDLLGLGSLLVDSNSNGQTAIFVTTLSAMIIVVTLMNFLVWQPLLRLSQRFKFD